MTTTSLLPCPFCGGPAIRLFQLVGCLKCETAAKSAEHWNNRTLPQKPEESTTFVAEADRTNSVLVGLQHLKAWRAEWLEENDPHDGTDCVTPFDHYLYETGITAEQALIRALASAPCGRNPIEGQAWPWVQAHMAHRSSFYHCLGLSENHQVILLVDLFLHIRNALAALGIDREFLRRHLGEGSPDQEGHGHG